MRETKLNRVHKLTGVLASVVMILYYSPVLAERLRGVMGTNPWLRSGIPIIFQVSIILLSLITLLLYLRNRRWLATGLFVILLSIVVTSALIGDAIVTAGILLLLGVGWASYWIQTRGWKRRRIDWNPPNAKDVRREIRKKERSGNLTGAEIDSLYSAIDGLDEVDLKILYFIDKWRPVTLIQLVSSSTSSFEEMATELSENVVGLGGKTACMGRLRKLENNGLIRTKGTWSDASRYTTRLGQRVVKVIREAGE